MKGFLKNGGIYFDTKPIEGSNNAVTSDGIAKAIKEGHDSYDDTELRNRITQAENDIDSLETAVSGFTKVLYKDVNVTTTSNPSVAPYEYFGNGNVSTIAGNFKIVSLTPTGGSTDVIACVNSVAGSTYGSFYVYSMQPGTFTITIGYIER